MSTVARTPVQFPKMKVRGRRNRTQLRRLTWAFEAAALAFHSLSAAAAGASDAIRKFRS